MKLQACIRDQRLHNKERQINYTAGYICKMNTNAATDETNWDQTWLAADQSQHALAKTVVSKDFLLQSNDIQHCTKADKHTFSWIFAQYFSKDINTQKFAHNNRPFVS